MMPGIVAAGLYGAFPPPPVFPNHSTTTGAVTGIGVTSIALPYPASVAVNDLLIVQVSAGGRTPSVPAGWTSLSGPHTMPSTTNVSLLFYRLALGTEGGTNLTIDISGSGQAGAHMFRVDAGTFRAAQAPESAISLGYEVQPNPPSLSPSWGSDKTLWIVALGRSFTGQTPSVYPLPDQQTTTNSVNTGGTVIHANSCSDQLEQASLDPGAFTFGTLVALGSACYTIAVRGG